MKFQLYRSYILNGGGGECYYNAPTTELKTALNPPENSGWLADQLRDGVRRSVEMPE